MFKKKLIFLLPIIILITSCESAGDIKRGITGAKNTSADEFLVEKKDPPIITKIRKIIERLDGDFSKEIPIFEILLVTESKITLKSYSKLNKK